MWRMGAVAVQKGNNRFLDVAANETSQAMISFVHVPSHSAATFAFLSPGSGGHVMHTLTLPFVSVGRHRLRVADGTGEVVLRIRPMTTHETRRRDEYDLVVGVEDVYVTSGRLLAKTCTPVAGGDRTREDDAVTSVRNKRRNSSQDMLPAKQWAPECLEQAAWWCQ
ncbi:hypothetical protein HKX48_000073 [Thoreauomyces humboldtii]|nr:hypothetical protein HKX48_000073 [Thoreauomyces humboldtii]